MFIDTDLTLERMKATAFLPDLADREHRETWAKKGALDTADKALLKARKILESDCPSLFSPEVEARIRRRFDGMVAGNFRLPKGWMAADCGTTGQTASPAIGKRNEGVAA
jgi:trimethylamine:corrinoid methyltransferase-like protein